MKTNLSNNLRYGSDDGRWEKDLGILHSEIDKLEDEGIVKELEIYSSSGIEMEAGLTRSVKRIYGEYQTENDKERLEEMFYNGITAEFILKDVLNKGTNRTRNRMTEALEDLRKENNQNTAFLGDLITKIMSIANEMENKELKRELLGSVVIYSRGVYMVDYLMGQRQGIQDLIGGGNYDANSKVVEARKMVEELRANRLVKPEVHSTGNSVLDKMSDFPIKFPSNDKPGLE